MPVQRRLWKGGYRKQQAVMAVSVMRGPRPVASTLYRFDRTTVLVEQLVTFDYLCNACLISTLPFATRKRMPTIFQSRSLLVPANHKRMTTTL